MRYLWCAVVPMLAQALAAWGAILATTGGGSFVPLAVMLLAFIAIPLTLLTNILTVRARRDEPLGAVLRRCWRSALLFPGVIVALYAVGILAGTLLNL